VSSNTASEFERLRDDFGWSIEEHAVNVDGVWMGAAETLPTAFSATAHQTLLSVEDRSLWFRWRNEIIADVLCRAGTPAAFWEIGAGNGVVSRHLETVGVTAVVVEPGEAGSRGAASRGIRHIVRASLEELALPSRSIPAAGAFDVLEHLERPADLLREIHRVLQPDGLFLASVPAFPFLWSEADVMAGHYRRYRRRTLIALLRRSGFRPMYINHHFAAATPLLLMGRALPWRLGVRRDPEIANRQYVEELGRTSRPARMLGDRLMDAERIWARHLPVPMGTSLVVAARRA
jgi:SAM-dependent methyltransferase